MRRKFNSMPTTQRGQVFRGSRYSGRPAKANRHGAYINPDKFVKKATLPEEMAEFVPQHRFNDLAISDKLKQNIAAQGYETPTPVQDGSIPSVLAGHDLLGLANTGTGKTAAFLIPIIERIKNGSGPALIMAPTRELAVQINDEFKAFSKDLGIYSALCVGGANIRRQIDQLRRRPQVVIGTPGRLKDLVEQRALKLGTTDILVLDEADRMLDMGFIRDIRYLTGLLPKQRQSLCFSATMPPDIEHLVSDLLNDPVKVSVRTRETADHVDQDVIEATSNDDKLRVLKELLAQPDFEKVLIFGRTKWGVQKLADNLNKAGITAHSIHGNKNQAQRQRALDAFKASNIRVLVATDVAARGLDIPKVSHVINFDQPNTYSDYVHRIGRTGRAGQPGKALTFIGRR